MEQAFAALQRFARSPAFKFFLILFLIVLLLVPLALVFGLVSEREGRARQVKAEVARVWGSAQQISGPYLVVPYTVRIETVQGDKRVEQTQERRAVFLPERLDIKADAASKTLHRSIYEVVVYTSKIAIEGSFLAPDMADVAADVLSVRWGDAAFVLAISDVSGLKEAATLTLNGQRQLPFAPSTGLPNAQQNGIHVKLAAAGNEVIAAPDAAPKPFRFALELALGGSSSLDFAPVARETVLAMTSDWPHPSFSGAFLPIDRSVRGDGFTASWRIPHLARSVPSAWTLPPAGLDRFRPYQFGVQLIQPVDFYGLVTRAAKYGVLFVALAFMAVFVLELMSGRRVHAVQYLFVGLAMVFFYVLLLSLAEQVGFAAAYLAAAGASGGMLALYVGKALESRRQGLIMLAVLLLLYGLLYLILNLEDYALLAGAILGFAALTAIMFGTLRVDWSGRGSAPVPMPAPAE
jgi:inner membrane protein